VDELQDLYRQVILDHNRNPRNFGELTDATRIVAGVNPLCGDKMTLYVKLGGGKIEDIRFQGTGCAISVASSSLMTERVKGLPVDVALQLFDKVHDLLTSPHDHEPPEDLDKLAALGGVREYPSRVKCASLGWHALKSAVADDTASNVTTE
jgi:nitrogen fixation NifU-like protein